MSAFSAKVFNQWRAFARRFQPRAGRNCTLAWTRLGTIISAADAVAAEEDHPWRHRIALAELPDGTSEWRATITPGLVNGRDASIEAIALDADERPSLKLAGWRDPLRGASVSATLDGQIVAAAGEGYPRFFEKLGVKPAARGGDITRPGALDTPEDLQRTRELRALDTALVVPRIAAQQRVTITDPASIAQALNISTVFVTDFLRSAAAPFAIKTFAKWTAPREPDALERLQGVAIEPQTDEIRIATVYMVSPPGATQDDVPDATWQPYVAHALFRNLMHASLRRLPAIPDSQPITLNTGLAFGIGDVLFAALLTPINDLNAQIVAYLQGSDFSGRFWSV